MQKLTTENKERRLTPHALERQSAIHENTAGGSKNCKQIQTTCSETGSAGRPPSGAATGHTSAGSSSGPTWRTRRRPPPRPPSPRTSAWPQAETITTVTYASRPTTHPLYLQAEEKSGGAASSRGEDETAREEEGRGQRAERKRRAVSINSGAGARQAGRPRGEGAGAGRERGTRAGVKAVCLLRACAPVAIGTSRGL